MAERPTPDDPALAAAARHALHDEELIAAFAGDDADEEEAQRARALVERCTTCRDLYADLAAIALTIRATPDAQATAAVRQAPRDFRLTPRQAAELSGRPTAVGLAQRLIEAIRGFGRPAGFALASFGLVGLLVGTIGFGPIFGGPASGGLGTTSNVQPGTAPEATVDTVGVVPLATDTSDVGGERTETVEMAAGEVPWLVILSAVVLVAGLGLLLANAQLRWKDRAEP